MGLHDALRPPTGWVWRWYVAYNRRAGRRHLLRVPLVKRENIRVPSWYYNEHDREQYIRRQEQQGPVYLFPHSIYEGNPDIRRLCDRAQAVYRWAVMDWWQDWRHHPQAPRGWCKRCWELAQTLPPQSLDGPENVIQSASSQTMRIDTDLERWIRYEQGHDD